MDEWQIQKWEYYIVPVDRNSTLSELEIMFNVYGKDGWQLVNADLNMGVAYFKRPLIEEDE